MEKGTNVIGRYQLTKQCSTWFAKSKVTHVWKIKPISRFLLSHDVSEFNTELRGPRSRWSNLNVHVYPSGDGFVNHEYMSLHLRIFGMDGFATRCILGIQDSEDNFVALMKDFRIVNSNEVIAFSAFIKKAWVACNWSTYLDQDVLKIRLDIRFTNLNHALGPLVPRPLEGKHSGRFFEDKSSILNGTEVGDMFIMTDVSQVSVHKEVLMERSSHFAEKVKLLADHDILYLSDLDDNMLGKLINFMYSWKMPELDLPTAKMLMVLSRRYCIPQLEHECLHYFCSVLNSNNVIELLVFADRLNHKDLKRNCEVFIGTYGMALSGIEYWDHFRLKHPELVLGIIDTLVANRMVINVRKKGRPLYQRPIFFRDTFF